MRITRTAVTQSCAICERTLLQGEQTVRFAPDGQNFVDVCPLCTDVAVEYGWLKEGSPTSPTVPDSTRRKRLSLAELFGAKRSAPESEPVASEPILRRLSEPELAMVEAADLFNSSAFRRTVAGVAKSLGRPRASILRISGVNKEVVVTIAWDISWYQYRITPEAPQPVRLEERGHEPGQLEGLYKEWNAHLDDSGRLVPDIARI
ncbi:MAG: hypothetical protein M3R70_04725 [Actinomycetota bacterium]|nr:hypothetical protein [Actinomycetota bacterium]